MSFKVSYNTGGDYSEFGNLLEAEILRRATSVLNRRPGRRQSTNTMSNDLSIVSVSILGRTASLVLDSSTEAVVRFHPGRMAFSYRVNLVALDIAATPLSLTYNGQLYESFACNFILGSVASPSPPPPPTCPYISNVFTCSQGQFVYVPAAGGANSDFSAYTCEECPAMTYQDEPSHRSLSCKAYNVDLCEPGHKLTADRDKTQDRACSPCKASSNQTSITYQSSSGHTGTSCTPLTVCGQGQYQMTAGTPITNRECASCTAGKFQDLASTTEGSCKTCEFGKYSSSSASSCTAHSSCANSSAVVSIYGTSVTHTVCQTCDIGKYYLEGAPTTGAFKQLSPGQNVLCGGDYSSFDNVTDATGTITTWPREFQFGNYMEGSTGCPARCTATAGCRAYALETTEASAMCRLYAHRSISAEPTTGGLTSECHLREALPRSCTTCPTSKYMADSSHVNTACLDVKMCGKGQHQLSIPWPGADRVCGSCVEGVTFQELESHSDSSCNACRDCNALGLEVQGECEVRRNTVCLQKAAESIVSDSTASTLTLVIVVIVFLAIIVVVLLIKIYRANHKPVDWKNEIGSLDELNELEVDNYGADPYFPREIKRGDIMLLDLLGNGAFGEVYKAVLDEQDTNDAVLPYTIAVKTLRLNEKAADASDKAAKEFKHEAFIMAGFHHPNVSGIIGAVTIGEPMLVALQVMENGELLKFLQKHSGFRVLTEGALLQISYDIALGMDYLHDTRILHRDLAARNVLVDTLFVCKIADFGLSWKLPENESSVHLEGKFPARWTAVEAFNHDYSLPSDVWAYGITNYEIFTAGAKPYTGKTNNIVMKNVKKGFRLGCPVDCKKQDYERIMLPCWNIEVDKRPTFRELIRYLEVRLAEATENMVDRHGKARLSTRLVRPGKEADGSKESTADEYVSNDYEDAAAGSGSDDGENDYTDAAEDGETVDIETLYEEAADDASGSDGESAYTEAAPDDGDKPRHSKSKKGNKAHKKKPAFDENDYTEAAGSDDAENGYAKATGENNANSSETDSDAVSEEENDYAEAAPDAGDDTPKAKKAKRAKHHHKKTHKARKDKKGPLRRMTTPRPDDAENDYTEAAGSDENDENDYTDAAPQESFAL